MGNALLVVEYVVGVDGEYGVGAHECAGEVDLTACLGIPPPVGHPNVTLAHRVLDRHLHPHLAMRGLELRPLAVDQTFLRRVFGVHEEVRRGHAPPQDTDVALPGLEERVFAHTGEHAVRELVARRRRRAVIGQRIETQVAQDRGRQLHLARRRRKPGLTVFAVLGWLHVEILGGAELLEGHARRLQPVVDDLLQGVPREPVAEAHGVGEVSPEPEGRARLLRRVGNGFAERQVARPRPRVGDVVPLAEDVARHDVVGQHRRGGHEDLVGDDQVLVEHRPQNLMLIRVAHQRVVAQREERLDRIRVAVGHRPEHLRRVRHVAAHHLIHPLLTPHTLQVRAEDLCGAVGVGRVRVVADLLGPLLRTDLIMELQLSLRPVPRVQAVEAFAADGVEVAGDGAQDALEPNTRGRVDLHVGDRGPRDGCPVRGGVHPRRLGDQLGVDATDLRDPLERVLVGATLQVLEPDAPLFDELLVVELLVDDDLHPAKQQSSVGSGLDLEVDRRLLRLLGHPRVDDDARRAACAGALEHVVDRRPRVLARVVTQQHEAVHVVEVRHGVPAVGEPTDRRGVAGAQRDARRPVR